MQTILVPTEQHDLTASMLQSALLLARRFDSYVEGFALFPAMVEIYALDSEISLPIEVKEHDAEMAQHARAVFERFMTGQGVPRSSSGAPSLSFDWLADAPDGDAFVGNYGRVFDVIVAGRPGSGRGSRPSLATIEAALFEAGRPVLIAWNCSTEQARATTAAKPLLRKASRVVVLTVQGGSVPGPTGEQLARYLQRNGVSCEAITVSPEGRSTGEAILANAASLKCDLLIKGAYTQSRLRQMIFGGATRHILANATIPVLMAR